MDSLEHGEAKYSHHVALECVRFTPSLNSLAIVVVVVVVVVVLGK
jgi:hypothetical protein